MLADLGSDAREGEQVPAVQVFALGGFRVLVRGHPVADDAWRRRSARQLFKVLLSRPNRRMTRDEVVELLWPESDHDAAASNLRSTIHALRRAVEPPEAASNIVFGDRVSVWLRSDIGLWLDADEFERVVQRAWRSTDPLPLLEQASALYAGNYLPDDLFEDWATDRRDALKHYWAELQIGLAKEFEHRGDAEAAIRPLQRLLQVDACDERAAQESMQLLARYGRRSEALRIYQRLSQALADDLGVEPSDETRELHRQISAGEAREIATALKFQCGYPFPAPMDLIGREMEMSSLERVLAMARTSGRAALVGAPAGTGKSALVGQLVRKAQSQGVLCLAGGCYEERGAVPLGPFHDALADFLLDQPVERVRSELGNSMDDLARIVPELRYRLQLSDEPRRDSPQADRMRIFGAVYTCLRGLAERTPTLLCLEDLHAADEASIELFHYLARQTRRLPLLLIGTYRSDEVAPDQPLAQMLAAVTREHLAEMVRLNPLGRDDTNRLAVALLDGSTSDSLAESLYSTTGGNPLFIEQLVLALTEEGQLRRQAGVWHGTTQLDRSPAIVGEVITQRLVRLPESCRQTLAVASVLGQTFEHEVLVESRSPEAETTILGDLDEAIGASVLRETSSGYAFRHALMRDAVYWSLSGPRRMLLHTRVGETLERRAGERAEDIAAELAYHFDLSGHSMPLRTKALQYGLVAGRRAVSLSAHREALTHFGRACDLAKSTGSPPASEASLNALEGRGRAERELAMWPRAVDTFRRVLDLTDDAIRRARVRAVLVSALLYSDPDQALEEVDAGLHDLLLAQVVGPETGPIRLQLESFKALIWFLRGRYSELLDLGEHMRRSATQVSDSMSLSRAHSVSAWAYLGRGQVPAAIREYEVALAQATDSGNKIQIAAVYTNLGSQYYLCGDFATARQHLARAVSIYRESVGDLPAVNALFNLARVCVAEGDLATADEQARAALTLAVDGQVRFAAECHQILGTIHLARTNWEAARDSFDQALAVHRQVGYVAAMIESLVGLGQAHQYEGDWPRAHDLFVESVRLADSIEPGPHTLMAYRHIAILFALKSEHEAAAEQLRRAMSLASQHGMRQTLQFGPTLISFGQVRIRAGDVEYGLRVLEDAVRACKTVVNSVEARLALAEALTNTGSAIQAREHASQALALGERLNAPRLIGLAHHALARAATALGEDGVATTSFAAAIQYLTLARSPHERALAEADRG